MKNSEIYFRLENKCYWGKNVVGNKYAGEQMLLGNKCYRGTNVLGNKRYGEQMLWEQTLWEQMFWGTNVMGTNVMGTNVRAPKNDLRFLSIYKKLRDSDYGNSRRI